MKDQRSFYATNLRAGEPSQTSGIAHAASKFAIGVSAVAFPFSGLAGIRNRAPHA